MSAVRRFVQQSIADILWKEGISVCRHQTANSVVASLSKATNMMHLSLGSLTVRVVRH